MSTYLFQVQFCDGRVEERSLGEGYWRIGREQGDLVLHDPSVSGTHGELALRSGTVTYTDLGSSNGSFDLGNQRLTQPLELQEGWGVRLGSSSITLLRASVGVPGARPTLPLVNAMARTPPAAVPADHADLDFAPKASAAQHPYTLAISSADFSEALRLMLKTMPFLLVRFGILAAVSAGVVLWWILLIGGLVLFGSRAPLLGWVWAIALIMAGGWLWRGLLRYFLYLIKAAHIAVLTEIITKGKVGNGSESMFEYGKRVVKERFGEVNIMFGLDLLIDGVVRAVNRTLDWLAGLLPVPGLHSIMSIVHAVLRASTTYIDETIFSYNLVRNDANVYRSSQDGLIYYAQNAKEILKTGLWVVVLEKVLSAATWVIMLGPAFLLSYLVPGSGGWVTLSMFVFALLFAADIRSAFLKPLFLTMVMIKFHTFASQQAINPEWDARLSSASDKFRELKKNADTWLSPHTRPARDRAPQME